ncbi:unnamed protein product [Durusdinium trenchii]|uniref:Secreted protein n=1 Tax=Durusdinium trenchii TaxID=1381693 RepID=A0ABP0QP93_9DINO
MIFLLDLLLMLSLPLLGATEAENSEASCLLQSPGKLSAKNDPNAFSLLCARGTNCICEDRGPNLAADLSTCATHCVNQPGFTFVSESDPIEGKSEICACCTSLASISRVSEQKPDWAGAFRYM